MISGLYAITRETDNTGYLLASVEAALRGGAAVVQYRDKSADVARQHEQASELLELCRRYHVPLIINDSLRLADLVGADGVHLGRDDGAVHEARIVLGHDRVIGVSCYQSLPLALKAQAAGADYVAFGSFFPSSTKPDASPADVTLLHEAGHVIHVRGLRLYLRRISRQPCRRDCPGHPLGRCAHQLDMPRMRCTQRRL